MDPLGTAQAMGRASARLLHGAVIRGPVHVRRGGQPGQHDRCAPLAEYFLANDRVAARKMFGLKGRLHPAEDGKLQTRGGLLYYQYDGLGNVTGLSDHLASTVMQYRYDVFGGIFTGISAPYNTVAAHALWPSFRFSFS